MRRALAIACTLAMTGCQYYYGKPTATTWNWADDHTACLRQVGVLSENQQYAMVSPGPYRSCMLAKGWQREEKAEPGWGWFRGVEDDGVVEIAGSPTAPAGSASRELWCRQTYVSRSGWETEVDRYWACLKP